MSFFGNSDEEARIASLERLFKMGFITKEDFTASLTGLKKAKEPHGAQTANALDIIQLALLAGIVGSVVYGFKLIK